LKAEGNREYIEPLKEKEKEYTEPLKEEGNKEYIEHLKERK
jgi:hypothetical protein